MKKIAIIGGGIGGLTAAYLLHSSHDITLYEKSNRLGGNAYTHQTKTEEVLDIAVGSVLGRVAENFLRLLREVNAPMVRQPKASLMSLYDLKTGKGMYPSFFNLKAMAVQGLSMVKVLPSYVRTLIFNRRAVRLLDQGRLEGVSVGEMFDLLPGLSRFEQLIVMAPFCLLSSMAYAEVLEGPAEYFVGKMKAHAIFNPFVTMVENHFPKNFTRSYVDALADHFRDKVVLNANIEKVTRSDDRVRVEMADGDVFLYDDVVFACNADQTLRLIGDPTPEETRLLGSWKYRDVTMVVHRDHTHSPRRVLCQPWNCIQSASNGTPHFSISYATWLLSPGVENKGTYISTQHAGFPINEELVDCRRTFRVPFYDFSAFAAMKELPRLNGKKHSYFCGSHFGYGLHGDAVNSAVRVARDLGVMWG